MPTDHGLRLHDDQNIRPSRPNAPQSGPEEPVETVEGWSRPFSFEDGNLLAKREYLKSGTGARANEDADCGQKCRNQVQHESTVYLFNIP